MTQQHGALPHHIVHVLHHHPTHDRISPMSLASSRSSTGVTGVSVGEAMSPKRSPRGE